MKISKVLKSHKTDFILGTLIKFLETIGDIVIPLLMSNIIDIGIKNNDTHYILFWGGMILLINIIGVFAGIYNNKLAAKSGQGVAKNIRNDLYKHISTFSYKELDKFGTSTLMNRFTNDISRIDNAVEMFVRQAARAPYLLIGSLVMMIIIAPKLSLIFVFLIPLLALTVYLIMRKTNKLFEKTQKNLDKVALNTKENLEGAKVVRAFNKQEFERNKFNKETDKLYKSQKAVSNISALLNPITASIINLGIIAVIWFGGLEVNVGNLTTGKIIAFVDYLVQIGIALVIIARIINVFIRAFTSVKRINEIFETKQSIVEKNTELLPIITQEETPKIEFQNVSFKYGKNSKPAIENLNVKIMKGQTVGIIGGTGSGKSTIVNLIPRFYDVSNGKVLVDGVDVRDYSLKQLRQQIGIVPQKAALFRGTIFENMLFRKADASSQEIQKALTISQSLEFVDELEGKLNYKVNAGGTNLSGGQRQRLTIARALVGDPEILILDDSSSALDFMTDAKLRKAIKFGIKNTTMLIVTQRLTTIKDADIIICVDKGQVVGIGKHNELLGNCEVYKEIYESQTK